MEYDITIYNPNCPPCICMVLKQWTSKLPNFERSGKSRRTFVAAPPKYENLGGGFKDFLFSPLLGEDSHFDYYFSSGLKPPTRKIDMDGCKKTCLSFWARRMVSRGFCRETSRKTAAIKIRNGSDRNDG